MFGALDPLCPEENASVFIPTAPARALQALTSLVQPGIVSVVYRGLAANGFTRVEGTHCHNICERVYFNNLIE